MSQTDNECETCGSVGELVAVDDFMLCASCKNEPDVVAQADATRGGWYYGKWLTQEEINAAEKRWADASYISRGECDEFQCGGCKHFAAFGADFGVCCNAGSKCDGRIVFEHGGCEQHSVKIARGE